MKYAHNITIRVFEKTDDFDINEFMLNLVKLFPKDIEEKFLFNDNNSVWEGINLTKELKNYLEKEKCELFIEEIKSKNAIRGDGSKIIDGNDIIKIEFSLNKDKHINDFLKKLSGELGKSQCELLVSQENRIDDECNYFIRLEKNELKEKNKFILTDSGNCFHIKIKLACYPNKKEVAMNVVKEIFE